MRAGVFRRVHTQKTARVRCTTDTNRFRHLRAQLLSMTRPFGNSSRQQANQLAELSAVRTRPAERPCQQAPAALHWLGARQRYNAARSPLFTTQRWTTPADACLCLNRLAFLSSSLCERSSLGCCHAVRIKFAHDLAPPSRRRSPDQFGHKSPVLCFSLFVHCCVPSFQGLTHR